MIRSPDPIYVVFRNDRKWRHFTSRQNAISYIAACCDLCPNDCWELRCVNVEVTGDA